MQLEINFKQINSDDAIKKYADKKSSKLKKFFNGEITVRWTFSEEKQDQIAHCHLTGNNMDYFGEAKTSSLYASIDQGIVKIEKQIQKHKEIIKDKRA